jgi:hypothetical protein
MARQSRFIASPFIYVLMNTKREFARNASLSLILREL